MSTYNPYTAPAAAAAPLGPNVRALPIAGLEGRVHVKRAVFPRGAQILLDGEPLKPTRGKFQISEPGNVHTLQLKAVALGMDPWPRVLVDGQLQEVIEKLPTWALVWCLLPFGMAPVGGAIGALFGYLGAYLNVLTFRSQLPAAAKWAITLVTTATAIAVVVAISGLIQMAVQK